MKLTYDPKNYENLKTLIASQLNNVGTESQETVAGSATFCCTLTDDSGLRLTSVNAACRYLFARGNAQLEDHESIDELVEWSSLVLKPFLVALIVSIYGKTKVDPLVLSNVNNSLQYLEKRLTGKQFLIANSLSSADVIVWTELFPIVNEQSYSKEYLSAYPKICTWFNNIANESSVKLSIKKLAELDSRKNFLKSLVIPSSDVKFSSHLETRNEPNVSNQMNEEQEITENDVISAYSVWTKGRENCPAPEERKHPILPKSGVRNILVTSALPYVNNVPHLGNIIGSVLSADVYSRFCRLRNYNILYICGTDEYGTATENKAIEEGLTPKQICDKYFQIHSDVYKWFQIDFDFFGRTTNPKQTEIAQGIFWKLHENNYLMEDTVEQLLCQKCNRFLADRFVNGTCPLCFYDDARGDQCDKCGKLINANELKDPKCSICKTTPVIRTSQHLFLDLPALESHLSDWLEKSIEKYNWTNSARVIARSWVKEGLKPRCITRDLKWGTPVPLEKFNDKVFYVWFDAPIGYFSISATYSDKWEQWWKNPDQVELYQFMAKDNVPFHSVVFPSTELGTKDNYTIVNHLIATEYLNYEDGKFSKSRGVGVFGSDAIESGIPADIWRFYLLFIRPENQDSMFNWSDLMTKNNTELLNNLGNFINRSLTFLYNNFDGIVPTMTLNDEDKRNLVRITRELRQYINLLEKVKEKDAIKNILNISRLGNQIMQASKPWELVKGTDDQKSRSGTIIGFCSNVACLLSVMLQPYMPTISQTIQSQLNAPYECNILVPQFMCFLPTGHKINKPSPLFKKIEQKEMDELRAKYGGQKTANDQQNNKKPSLENSPVKQNSEVEKLLAAIADQGNKIRELKANKADKIVIDHEVNILLSIKTRLIEAGGQLPTQPQGKSKKKKSSQK